MRGIPLIFQNPPCASPPRRAATTLPRRGHMDQPVRDDPEVITRREIEDAAAALFCRFGDPGSEASRRGRLKGFLDASRALSHALDAFTAAAAGPFRGQYSTTHLDAEVDAMTDALVVWSQYAAGAARLYHDCRHEAPARAERSIADVASGTSTGTSHAP